jgi:hypothetical protein
MPWKECKLMDERIRLIGRLLESEKMAPAAVLPRVTRARYTPLPALPALPR